MAAAPNTGEHRPLAVVTGGTGIVGSALVQRLATDLPDYHIVVLTRKPDRAETVFADLERPDLGLDRETALHLQNRATLIVHCAADTRFNLTLEQARLTNVEGTRHMLDFARQCERLTQFAHISTLYVAGRREGLVPEAPLRHDAGYVNTYEQAKHEAEELVLAEASRMPVGIYRLSSVVDEAGTGGHFRQVIRFVPWGEHFPFFPADPSVPVDLISSEWTARVLSLLIARSFVPGCVRHICAGAAGSLPVGAVMDRAFRAYEASAGSPVRRPRLVSMARFEPLHRRLPAGSRLRRALASLMTFIPHLSIPQPFDTTKTSELLAGIGAPRADMNSLLSRVLADQFRAAEGRS